MEVASFTNNSRGFYVWGRTATKYLPMVGASELRILGAIKADAYCRELEKKAGADAREQEAVGRKLPHLENPPAAPGSARPKHHMGKESRNLLNDSSSTLDDFRRRRSIRKWKLKFGKPKPEHAMTGHAQKIPATRKVHRRRSAACDPTLSRWLYFLAPLISLAYHVWGE